MWPIIEAAITKFLKLFMDWLEGELKNFLEKRSQTRAHEADKRAAEAEGNAATAQNDADRARFEGKAEAWREAAEEEREDLVESFKQIEAIFVEARMKQQQATSQALQVAQEPSLQALDDQSMPKLQEH